MKSAVKSMKNLYNLNGSGVSSVLYREAEKHKKHDSLSADAVYGVSAVGSAIITGIAASGIGVPLASGIAVVLVVIKNIALLLVDMWKLKSIIPDVINILFYNLLLLKYMNKTEEIISIKIKTEKKSETSIKPDNNLIEQRIFEKINILLSYLLKSVDIAILKKLINNIDIKNISSLYKIISDEINLRESRLKIVEKLRQICNKFASFIDSQRIIINIISDLSIITGFFNILKSKFDTLLILIQHKYSIYWSQILETVINSDEYKQFMNKNDNNSIVNSIIENTFY
uniref:Uncharacterized protein n=1 Tax=viral metagenome TaxID=1070528 RepID=A0A6C0EI65_9ZZZZ